MDVFEREKELKKEVFDLDKTIENLYKDRTINLDKYSKDKLQDIYESIRDLSLYRYDVKTELKKYQRHIVFLKRFDHATHLFNKYVLEHMY